MDHSVLPKLTNFIQFWWKKLIRVLILSWSTISLPSHRSLWKKQWRRSEKRERKWRSFQSLMKRFLNILQNRESCLTPPETFWLKQVCCMLVALQSSSQYKNVFVSLALAQGRPQTCCKLWILTACYKLSTSFSKSVDFIKLQQVCEYQTCCNLIFAVVETTCIKLVDKKSWQSTCMLPVDNLQQTCYRQVGASDANASWYRLDYCWGNPAAADLLQLAIVINMIIWFMIGTLF